MSIARKDRWIDIMMPPQQLFHLLKELEAARSPSSGSIVVFDLFVALHQGQPLPRHLVGVEVLPKLCGKLCSHLFPQQFFGFLPQPHPPVEVINGLCWSLSLYRKMNAHQVDEEEGLSFVKHLVQPPWWIRMDIAGI